MFPSDRPKWSEPSADPVADIMEAAERLGWRAMCERDLLLGTQWHRKAYMSAPCHHQRAFKAPMIKFNPLSVAVKQALGVNRGEELRAVKLLQEEADRYAPYYAFVRKRRVPPAVWNIPEFETIIP